MQRQPNGRLVVYSEGDVAWRTSIVKVGSRYFVAGANLGILEDGKLSVVGR
jgi:hypothetical protein